MILRAFGFTLDLETGLTRKWYFDKNGDKRWYDSDSLVMPEHKQEPKFYAAPISDNFK